MRSARRDSNADVFGELCSRLGFVDEGKPSGELDLLVEVLDSLPGTIGAELRNGNSPVPPFGSTPIQFVDVFPNTADRKVDLFPAALEATAPVGLYRYQPDPATDAYPLTLISPSSERTISSTLGELPRPDVKLTMHPDDAAARGLADNDLVRIFNELGEVQCTLSVLPTIRPGTVSLPKGLWRAQHAQRLHRQRPGARHADRPRRRRLLQRRARAGGFAGQRMTLSVRRLR
jgi:anaerobic selenocysteine-containing dehydrogenase